MNCLSTLSFTLLRGELIHPPSSDRVSSFTGVTDSQFINRPEPDISSPNSQTRHDGLQRLRTILDNFFQNLPTSTTGLEVGEILSADTIYYARCQAARRLAQNLRAHIRQATGTAGSRNQLSAWKMQRALYWYSVVSLFERYNLA